ncbi:alpha/beta hydrolase family protein [Phenylobacterium koreense]|uniref:Acetyl esterase/lipase n=1 Tax=Phenylobacterium koreense TaxID=266125 RepID=A0ABV2ENJ7_9CAUL
MSTAPIGFADLLARPRAQASVRIAYGPDPLQFGELWLPEGPGPHPTVAMIHGGCWRADLPGLELMDYAAEDLARRGLAVWNIEYRRLGHEGGGYPGTFLDIAAGLDHLRTLAQRHPVDITRAVLCGHSAGGHLAVWALARARLAKTSPLWSADPLLARGAVALAGIIDLAAYHASGPDECGGPGVIDALVGAGRRDGEVYADTSPPSLLPIGARQVVVSGALDYIVPSRFGADYGAAARKAGDEVEVVDFAGAGHFELIDPTSAVWPDIYARLARLLA